MDTKEEAEPATFTKEIELPAWEHARGTYDASPLPSRRRLLPSLHAKYRSIMSSISSGATSRRSLLGLSPRMWLLAGLVFIMIVAGVVVGVVVGLTRARQLSSSQALSLPSNSQNFSGDLTYYDTSLGACGEYSTADDDIVAVSHIIFDAAGSSTATGGDSNLNPLCNRQLRATRYDSAAGEQKSVDLTVVDRCTGCEANDLDTSTGVFAQMASIAQGRVDVTWAWLPA